MNTPEIWARPGKDLTLSKASQADLFIFRVTDQKSEVTITHHVGRKDLLALRKWIKRYAK